MKGKTITTLIAIMAGVGICVWVFWPESNSPKVQSAISTTVSNKTNEQLDSISPAKKQEMEKEAALAIEKGENLPVIDKEFTMKKKEEQTEDELAVIAAIENTVDSAISIPDKRIEIANRAEKTILMALKKYNNPYLNAAYADLLYYTGREDEAIKQYAIAYPQLGRIPEFTVNYATAVFKAGKANFYQGDFIGSIAKFETVLKLNPKHPELDSNLYKSYLNQIYLDLQLDNYDNIVRYINNALLIDDNKFNINFYAGVYNADPRISKNKKAIAHFEKCKSISPINVDVRQMLYNLYIEQGDSVTAKKQLIRRK